MVILLIKLRPFVWSGVCTFQCLEFILKHLDSGEILKPYLRSWQRYAGIPCTPFSLNDSENRIFSHESPFVCILLGLKVANTLCLAKQCFPEVSHYRIKIKFHHRCIAASNLTITMDISLGANYTRQLSVHHIRRTLTSCTVTTEYRLDKVKYCAIIVKMLAVYELWVHIHLHIGRTSVWAWGHQVTYKHKHISSWLAQFALYGGPSMSELEPYEENRLSKQCDFF